MEVLGEAQAVAAGLERADGLLERLLVGLADGHDLAHGAHLGAQLVLDALELLERPACELDDDVVAARDVVGQRAVLAAGDLVEREAARQHRGHERDGEAGGFGRQRRGARGARVDLDDDVAVGDGVVRPLHVGAADDLHGLDDLVALLLQALLHVLADGEHGGGAERVAGVHAHGVDVLDEAHRDHLAVGVAHHLEFELLPTQHALLDEDLMHGGGGQAACDHRAQLVDVVHESAARAAHGVCGAQHAGVSQLVGDGDGVLDGVGDLAARHLDVERLHELLERLAVLAAFDRVDLDADDLHVVFLEDALLGQVGGQVQAGLAAQVGQQRVGALLGDDLLEARGVERLDVDGVRRVGIGHDGGGVAVDQHHLVSELAQGLAGLRAGVIELARLTDDDRTGADDEHFVDVVALWHGDPSLRSRDDARRGGRRRTAGGSRAGACKSPARRRWALLRACNAW